MSEDIVDQYIGKYNELALAIAQQANEEDPFDRKPQQVRLRTRAKLAVRNWNRKRKLGVDVG